MCDSGTNCRPLTSPPPPTPDSTHMLWSQVQSTVQNVVTEATTFGARYIVWWELYCNEPIASATATVTDSASAAQHATARPRQGTSACPNEITDPSLMRG